MIGDAQQAMPVLGSMWEQADGFVALKLVGIGLGVVGLVFFLGAAVGMVRFPDFYTRMHAAGKGDTLSSLLILAGFALINLDEFSSVGLLLVVKVLGIVLFIMLTSPTSTHALMRAGYEDGVEPATGDDEESGS